VDAASPSLVLDSPADASWTKGPTRVAGKAEDPNGVVAVELSVNGGPRTRLEPRPAVPAAASAAPPAAPAAPAASSAKAPVAKPAAAPVPAAAATPSASAAPAPAPAAAAPKGPLASYSFDAELPLAEAEDGILRLELFARDSAGRESSLTRFVYKDNLPPSLSLVLPPPGEAVNGTTTLVGEAADSGRLASASFSAAKGAAAEEVLGLSVFSRTVDLARVAFPLPEGSGFSVADRAGNVAILSPELLVDKEKDKPVVEIAAPAELEVIRADFFVSGTAFDDDGVAAIEAALDAGDAGRQQALAARERLLGARIDLDPRRPAGVPRFAVKSNPVALIPRIGEFEQPRSVVIEQRTLKEIWRTLVKLGPEGAFGRLALLSLQRLKQLQAAQIDGSTLLIRDTKGRAAQEKFNRLPITPAMAAALRDGALDLPGGYAALNLTLRPYGLRATDLRRTAETFLSDRGVSGEDRGHLLSHGLERNPLVRRHYDRAERLDRKAELLAMWQTYATTKAPKRERARNG